MLHLIKPLESNRPLERLIEMVYITNIVALDKALWHATRDGSYRLRADWLSTIKERMDKAVYEIGMTLPEEWR